MARPSDNVLPGGVWSPENTDGTQIGLSLDRYAELMQWGINGFNGVNKPDDRENVQCNAVWLQSSRDRVMMAILDAEIMREAELGYFLGPKYVYAEQVQPYNPVDLNKKHLIGIGIPTWATIQLAAPLVLGPENAPNDPVTLSIASTVTPAEVKVYYPDDAFEILPTSVTSDGATLTIKIPRARLVDPSLNDDREDPLSYYKNANFLTTVDVRRLYLDEEDAALYYWRRGYPDCDTDCELDTQAACFQFPSQRAYRLSMVTFRPAKYSAGVWSTSAFTYSNVPNGLQVTYKSGRDDMMTQRRTARLAHTLLPYKPCDCQAVTLVWDTDRAFVPNTYTPYGSQRGAVEAWVADSRQRVGQGGKYPSMNMSRL